MYTKCISFILMGMVCAGASQTVAARALFQSGFAHPFFVTLLYHSGQSLSLIVYFACPKFWKLEEDDEHEHGGDTLCSGGDEAAHEQGDDLERGNNKTTCFTKHVEPLDILTSDGLNTDESNSNLAVSPDACNFVGSRHGLGRTSTEAARWVHSVPLFLMPLISAFFSLTNNALRWASLVFVTASVAEMINSGLELLLSVLAARYIRKRLISGSRWVGVAVVTVGVVLVGIIHLMFTSAASTPANSNDGTSSVRDQAIGICMIFGQSVLSVMQDISEEFFLQEAKFPPILMLGMVGLYSLSIALVFYFPLAPLVGEDPSVVRAQLSAPKMAIFAAGFVVLNTVTDSFNILAITRTSAMTRVVWRNLRTCLVWIMGLIIFYASSNPALGEEWHTPSSFYTLIAFAVMICGIRIYYGHR